MAGDRASWSELETGTARTRRRPAPSSSSSRVACSGTWEHTPVGLLSVQRCGAPGQWHWHLRRRDSCRTIDLSSRACQWARRGGGETCSCSLLTIKMEMPKCTTRPYNKHPEQGQLPTKVGNCLPRARRKSKKNRQLSHSQCWILASRASSAAPSGN